MHRSTRSGRSSTMALKFGKAHQPRAGVVTAFRRVEGRWCMVIANDNTVASGAWWPKTPGEDPARADDGAAPAAPHYLSGRLLRAVPAGAVTKLQWGHGRRPHLQDEQPAVRGRRAADRRRVRRLHRGRRLHADHQRPRLHDRAGVHGHRRRRVDQRRQEPADHQPRHRRARGARAFQSGCADVRVPDDTPARSAFGAPRWPASPASGADFYRTAPARWSAAYSPRELGRTGARRSPRGLRRRPRSSRVCATRACSGKSRPTSADGDDLRGGPGRRALRGLRHQPAGPRVGSGPGHMAAAGRPAFCTERGIAKISAFSRACNDDGLPLIWLQDISGFDIGHEAERRACSPTDRT